MHASVYVYDMYAGTLGGQKRGPSLLELQVVVSHPMWVLGAEHRSSGIAVRALTHEPSLQPLRLVFYPSVMDHLTCHTQPGIV